MDVSTFKSACEAQGLHVAVGEVAILEQMDSDEVPYPMIAAAFRPDISVMQCEYFLTPTGEVMALNEDGEALPAQI